MLPTKLAIVARATPDADMSRLQHKRPRTGLALDKIVDRGIRNAAFPHRTRATPARPSRSSLSIQHDAGRPRGHRDGSALDGYPRTRNCRRRRCTSDRQLAPPNQQLRTKAFASRWLVPRLCVPLEVIGTDAVLDLRSGDADVAIRNAAAPPASEASIDSSATRSGPCAVLNCFPGMVP